MLHRHAVTAAVLVLMTLCPARAPAQSIDSLPAKPIAEPSPDVTAIRAAERKIRAALARPLTLKPETISLEQFVIELEKQLGFRAGIARAALHENGIDPAEVQLTVDARDVSARTVLQTALRRHGLDWVIRDERLYVTTAIDADSHVLVRVYDIGDLSKPAGNDRAEVPIASLIAAVQGTTSGPWKTIDGTGGSIYPMRADGLDVLVVSQTRRVHDEIESLLADLREHRQRSQKNDDIPEQPAEAEKE